MKIVVLALVFWQEEGKSCSAVSAPAGSFSGVRVGWDDENSTPTSGL